MKEGRKARFLRRKMQSPGKTIAIKTRDTRCKKTGIKGRKGKGLFKSSHARLKRQGAVKKNVAGRGKRNG